MPTAGLDVHKKVVEACVLDEQGKPHLRQRFACDRASLEAFAKRHLGPECRVALEATTNTWAIVAVLTPLVGEVVVSNPLRTKAIASAKVKTDKVDAQVLAELLYCDYLPRVWQPDPATRSARHLCARRAAMVAERTRIKNRIHAVFHQRLLTAPADLFGTAGRRWLATVAIDEEGRAAVDSELRLLDAAEREVEQLDDLLVARSWQDSRAKLLLTLPGVDYAVAQALLAALGDPARFHSGDHAASYLGLVPSTRQSADHCYHGPITKQGKGHARWMLVQAAQHLDRHPGPLGVFFRRLMQKKGRNVAVVATARKLVVVAWHMLMRNQPYRYADPGTLQSKFTRLRVRATGERRKTGPAPGTPRPERGRRRRTTPSLAEVYEREGLAALAAPPVGERNLMASAPLHAYLEKISSPQSRVSKTTSPEREGRPRGKLALRPALET